jgi:2',3'-cyclic-nucleotide 2'-phosphodiesterase (5'-nucleotidase family)
MMNDLWNMVPMNPPISTVDLRGEEIVEMLEENLERTYSRDPYSQMGGYAKRVGGMTVYVRIENPRGHRIQRLMIGDEPVEPGRMYPATFVTEQGVGPEYGENRQETGIRAVEALRSWVEKRSPVRSELRGSIVQF